MFWKTEGGAGEGTHGRQSSEEQSMRALVQRVARARITIDHETERQTGAGYLVLLGIGSEDGVAEAELLWRKIRGLRIFDDGAGRANLSIADVDGEVMIVSQFTLYANCRRGMRPSFTDAARPEQAVPLYEAFVAAARAEIRHVETGEFGADMQIELVNDGPFTIWLDTDELKGPGR